MYRARSQFLIWAAFISVALLLASFLAIGLSVIDAAIEQQKKLSYDNSVKSELIITMRTAARERNVGLQTMLFLQGDKALEAEWARIGDHGGTFAYAREKYLSMQHTDNEMDLLEKQAKLSGVVGPLQNHIAELIVFGDKPAAQELLYQQAIPGQQEVFNLLSELLDIQKQETDAAAQESERKLHLVIRMVAVAGFLLLSISAYIIHFISKKVEESEAEVLQHRQHLEELVNERTESLQKALMMAQQANIAKTEFVSTVSHELRTPLTSIMGALGIVLSGTVGNMDAKVKQLLEISENNAKRLHRLINDILDIQKIESGQMEYKLEKVDIGFLIERAIEDVKPMAEQTRVLISYQKHPEAIYIIASADRITQVINNLLSNAIKFSPENDTIEIQLINKLDSVMLLVKDHGPGVDKAFQETIFEKFTQVDSSDARRYGGTGLGLNISRAIIEHHHGKIGVMKNEGNGSTFYIELPKHSS